MENEAKGTLLCNVNLSSIEVVAVGAINVDTFFAVSSLKAWRDIFSWWPSAGEGLISSSELQTIRPRLLDVAYARPIFVSGGGQAANFALAASRCGPQVALLGAVGIDSESRIALGELDAVDTSFVRYEGRTGRTFILVEPDGDREILIHSDVDVPFCVSEFDIAAAKCARHVHCTSTSGLAQLELQSMLFAQLPPTTTTSLDIGVLYARLGLDRLRTVLRRLSVLFATEEELYILTGAYLDNSMGLLFETGVEVVCCKRGSHGALLWDREGTVTERHAPSVQAIDSTGAGDVLAGVLVSARLRGIDYHRSLGPAVRLATESVTGWGRSRYPVYADFRREMKIAP